ncbi:MAG: hypothetical protein HUJ65_01610, partial [Oscillospiraceae bacterium]|nr:hypothetical protein [Oscillospiraceae bacterium]
MSKKIFIVGGSYFVGRVFCIQAARSDEFELTVMNRGRTPIRKPNIREFKCDRNNLDAFKADVAPQIAGEVFDAVIDTCAYEPGQIRNTIAMMAGQIRHYIYISTASVYSTDDLSERCEDDPVMDEPKTSTEMSDYVYKKLLLEYELKDACAQHGIEYT